MATCVSSFTEAHSDASEGSRFTISHNTLRRMCTALMSPRTGRGRFRFTLRSMSRMNLQLSKTIDFTSMFSADSSITLLLIATVRSSICSFVGVSRFSRNVSGRRSVPGCDDDRSSVT